MLCSEGSTVRLANNGLNDNAVIHIWVLRESISSELLQDQEWICSMRSNSYLFLDPALFLQGKYSCILYIYKIALGQCFNINLMIKILFLTNKVRIYQCSIKKGSKSCWISPDALLYNDKVHFQLHNSSYQNKNRQDNIKTIQ